jgi:hypothetical protein
MLTTSTDLPPSPPPIEQSPFVAEREAALASRLAEQRSERVALGAKRDEIEREARTQNAAKIPLLESQANELRTQEQNRIEELREEIRELEQEESRQRERLTAALLDPATRSQRSDGLQASITQKRNAATKAEADGVKLIVESGPGRLGGFFPFLPQSLSILERTEQAQKIALPVLALLLAVAPAFVLELAVSGARRAWLGEDSKGRGRVRGFWILRRRLSRQLKAATKERRSLETERAKAAKSLDEERTRLAAEIDQRASQRFSELVAQFDGLKTLEEFRDETAKVIREHRDDIRKLAEKVIELDAARDRRRV